MAKIKTTELAGHALDFAVVQAEKKNGGNFYQEGDGVTWVRMGDRTVFRPSMLWEVAGPIIWRENIALSPPTSPVHRTGGPNAGNGVSGVWTASTWYKGVNGRRSVAWDTESPIVAAMRAYAISKLGDEAEVPYELLIGAA